MFKEAILHFKGSLATLQNDSKVDILKSNYLGSVSPKVNSKKKKKFSFKMFVPQMLLRFINGYKFI